MQDIETATAAGKRPTGIPGLDSMARGGLPVGETTLIVGGPGAGKSVLALQTLVHAAERGEPGVFVAFEESSEAIRRHAARFDWSSVDGIRFVDARPDDWFTAAGTFDLDGLYAVVRSAVEVSGASWVVLDGIDQLTHWLDDPRRESREIARLTRQLGDSGVTTLLTAKRDDPGTPGADRLSRLEYALGATIELTTHLSQGRLTRGIRIRKFRGSPHEGSEIPMLITAAGLRVAYLAPDEATPEALGERIGTGMDRLDALLGGGYFRGSSVLLSGAPGTSKTTLALLCAKAAVDRGERALIVTFDESRDQIVRNVRSVGVDLAPTLETGRLTIDGLRHWHGSVASHFIDITDRVDRCAPDVLVIDPISAMLKAGDQEESRLAIERLVDLAKARGITALLTSLESDDGSGTQEHSVSHVSTIADTWIAVSYRVLRGERNRALSIIKSRGTRHSNQVRELVLGPDGVTLADVYKRGREVLMGTARVDEEIEVENERREQERVAARERRRLERELEEARRAQQHHQRVMDELQEELQAHEQTLSDRARERGEHRARIAESRRSGEEGNREQ